MALVQHAEVAVEHQSAHHVDLPIGRLAEQEECTRRTHQPLGALPDFRRNQPREQRLIHRLTLPSDQGLASLDPVFGWAKPGLLLHEIADEAQVIRDAHGQRLRVMQQEGRSQIRLLLRLIKQDAGRFDLLRQVGREGLRQTGSKHPQRLASHLCPVQLLLRARPDKGVSAFGEIGQEAQILQQELLDAYIQPKPQNSPIPATLIGFAGIVQRLHEGEDPRDRAGIQHRHKVRIRVWRHSRGQFVKERHLLIRGV